MDRKISVIVPCYNVENEIDRCVESLVGQTIGIENLELIFVDDASVDQTMQKLAEWEQRYPENILVIHCEENGRQGTARNIGLSYASGDYIGFIDADDWIEADMYETLFCISETYACDVSGITYQREDTDGHRYPVGFSKEIPWNQLVTVETEQQRKQVLKTGLPGGICTKLYRADLMREQGLRFPEKLAYEDNYFGAILRYCVRSYYLCDQVKYHYMVNAVSTTMQQGTRHFDRLKIELMKLAELQNRGYWEPYHDEIEFDFIRLFYCNSLALFFTKLPVTPYDMIRWMADTLKTRFPNYNQNPYLDQLNSTDKMFLEIVNQGMSEEAIEQIADAYRRTVIEYMQDNNGKEDV